MRKVAVVVQDGAEPFGLGAMCEVWAEPYHPEDDNPVFDFVIATPNPGRVRGPSGYDLHVENGLDAAADADLVCIAPKRSFRKPSPEVAEVVRAAHERGAYVFAHCTAAFVLGEAGLLDGRRCTTHWSRTTELARRFRKARVLDDRLWITDGNITTSAGIASGIDMALALIEQMDGPLVAAEVAREMVVYLRRDGSQQQESVYLDFRTHLHPGVHRVQDWIVRNPARRATLDQLADVAGMSSRSLTRTFRGATGISVHEFTTRVRVELARSLLHDPGLTMEAVAQRCGFATARQLRRVLRSQLPVAR